MTRQQLVELAEYKETFDYAVPQDWVNNVQKLGVDGRDFVWTYPAEHKVFGQPRHVGQFALDAVNKGNLIPKDTVRCAVEMALQGKHTVDEIMKLVEYQCTNR